MHNLDSMNPIQGLLLKLQLTNLPVDAETPGTRASIVYCLFLGLPPDTFFSVLIPDGSRFGIGLITALRLLSY